MTGRRPTRVAVATLALLVPAALTGCTLHGPKPVSPGPTQPPGQLPSVGTVTVPASFHPASDTGRR